MAAPYYGNSYLSQAINDIRALAVEPKNTDAFTTASLCRHLARKMEGVINEVYAQSMAVPMVRYTFTISNSNGVYVAPPNVKEVTAWYSENNAESGAYEGRFKPRSRRHPGGPLVAKEGHSIRINPLPEEWLGTKLTIEYIPGHSLMLHQGMTPIYAGDNDTGDQLFVETTTPKFTVSNPGNLSYSGTPDKNYAFGVFDQRPNAFLGHRVRFLGTPSGTLPTGYATFPVSEGIVTGFDQQTGVCTLQTDVDFDPTTIAADKLIFEGEATGRTRVVYEILPDVDPLLMHLGALRTARMIARKNARDDLVRHLGDEYDETLRDAQLIWANQEQAQGKYYDTDEASGYGDDMDDDMIL